MQELIAEQPTNWLQLYVDAMTEKNPYKRLALVRQLRQIPRHDESEEAASKPRLQLVAQSTPARPARQLESAPVIIRKSNIKRSAVPMIGNRKPKTIAKPARRSGRLRSA